MQSCGTKIPASDMVDMIPGSHFMTLNTDSDIMYVVFVLLYITYLKSLALVDVVNLFSSKIRSRLSYTQL